MDDRRHARVDGDIVVVNMTIASSHASIYRECVENVGQSDIEVPSYTWSCSHTAANMLHYMGRFKVKRMIEARPFPKNDPDAHYCNAIYNFMKQRAINHRTD